MAESPQHKVEQWEQQTFGVRSMRSRFEKLNEEVHEVFDPLSKLSLAELESMTDEQKEYFAQEATDLIIISLGIIGGLGYSFDSLFQQKMVQIQQKYPPEVARFLRRRGINEDQAMEIMKQAWNK